MVEVAAVDVELLLDLLDMPAGLGEVQRPSAASACCAQAVLHRGQPTGQVIGTARVQPTAVAQIADPDLDTRRVAPWLLVQPQDAHSQVVEFPDLPARTIGRGVAYLGCVLTVAQYHVAACTGIPVPLHLDRSTARIAGAGGQQQIVVS